MGQKKPQNMETYQNDIIGSAKVFLSVFLHHLQTMKKGLIQLGFYFFSPPKLSGVSGNIPQSVELIKQKLFLVSLKIPCWISESIILSPWDGEKFDF